jgi:hypothetical protein
MNKMTIGLSCAALLGGFATGCGSTSNATPHDGGAPDSGTSTSSEGGTAGDAGAMCCNKLTDNIAGCDGGAMSNDECLCLPVPAGSDCAAVLPADAGPIVTSCTGFDCCFYVDGGSCTCISMGDVASCYGGASATCSSVASANGGTVSTSCP